MCLITLPDPANALFIPCNTCIQVYFAALCARCLSVEHCALPLLCCWTPIQPTSSPLLSPVLLHVCVVELSVIYTFPLRIVAQHQLQAVETEHAGSSIRIVATDEDRLWNALNTIANMLRKPLAVYVIGLERHATVQPSHSKVPATSGAKNFGRPQIHVRLQWQISHGVRNKMC